MERTQPIILQVEKISYLVGALSPVNHTGLRETFIKRYIV